MCWNEYAADEHGEAVRAFEDVEAATDHFPGTDTVLVRVTSVDALRDAYPSYFADTRAFSELLRRLVGDARSGPVSDGCSCFNVRHGVTQEGSWRDQMRLQSC